MLVFGDIGQTEIADLDGIAFGAGLLYQIDGLFANSDSSIKVAYHTGEVEDDFFEADVNNITLQFLVSGNQLGQTNFGWYGNIGAHIYEAGAADDTELGFGGGIFAPTSFGEFYLGINHIDEISFGGGARFTF